MAYDKKTYTGTIAIRGKNNLGFVKIPQLDTDVVIPGGETGIALDGDTVEVTLTGAPVRPGKAPEAKLIKLISRAREMYVGNVIKLDGKLRFIADKKTMHIYPEIKDAASDLEGKKVVATLTQWTNPHTLPVVTIKEVLGGVGEHEAEMRALIRAGGFISEFPESVHEAANELFARQDEIFKEAIDDPKRRDMRSATTFTIDPADAKDFDDALSVEKLENGNYQIGVHIADVSYYVRPKDALDTEAQKRGTSIYMVDRVIPMLPEVLSNDLCSLRPDTDRLAFSAVFEMSADGTVTDQWYGQTVIHSDRRFTYHDAQDIFDAGHGDFFEEIDILMKISRVLRKKRKERGALNFESEEIKFELDEEKRPVRVYVKSRTETMMMIEDFMLLANTEVAQHVNELAKKQGQDTVFVYRIHDTPNEERIDELATFLKALGYELKSHNGTVTANDLNAMLKSIEGAPEEALIKVATIRSMAKAIYSTQNIGHFGLAFKYYTHFTSPIRRYPDIMVHRLLRKYLNGTKITPEEARHFELMSSQNSESEIKAVRIERDSIRYKQVEYMLPKVGQTFDATISGVSDWGIFVQDKVSKAEGLIRLNALGDDYFENIPGKYEVRGKRNGKTFRLGDPIRVRLISGNLEEKTLDFAVVDGK